MSLEIYGLDPAYFFSAPRLERQVTLKNAKVKLDLLNDIDMSLMVEKGTRGGTDQYYSIICHATHQYAHANNSYMKDTDKNKESLYLKYWDVNHLNR